MDQAVAQNQDLADRLAAALQQDEFVLYAQLIAPLAPNDGKRPFQEILIRFQEEEAKLLHPGSFFPVLEDCGLMHYVDRWVVSRVCKWVRGALAVKPDWPVPQNSVNLSTATLSDRYFAAYTRRQLQIAAVPKGTLSFEITCDSAATNVAALLELMAQLGPAGCNFVLARFDGSKGAFELLRLLAPEFVKLSPGLVRVLDQGKAGLSQVAGINRECQALGIKTIAEHVESEHTGAQLRTLGVDFGQGYAIQLPRPLA